MRYLNPNNLFQPSSSSFFLEPTSRILNTDIDITSGITSFVDQDLSQLLDIHPSSSSLLIHQLIATMVYNLMKPWKVRQKKAKSSKDTASASEQDMSKKEVKHETSPTTKKSNGKGNILLGLFGRLKVRMTF